MKFDWSALRAPEDGGGAAPAAGTAEAAQTALAATNPDAGGETLLNQGEAPTEAPKEGDKPTEPTKFDIASLKLPEGFSIPDDAKGELSSIAEKYSLSNEAIQDLIALSAKESKAAADKPYQLWKETNDKWVSEVKADAEIGGDKLPQVLATVNKAMEQFADPGFKQALDLTGAGNNPAIIKTLYKMSQALVEGGPVTGGKPAGQAEKPGSAAAAMYPHLAQKG